MRRRTMLLIIFKIGKIINQPFAVERMYPLPMNPLNTFTNTAKNNINDFSTSVLGRLTNAWYKDNTSPDMKIAMKIIGTSILESYFIGNASSISEMCDSTPVIRRSRQVKLMVNSTISSYRGIRRRNGLLYSINFISCSILVSNVPLRRTPDRQINIVLMSACFRLSFFNLYYGSPKKL